VSARRGLRLELDRSDRELVLRYDLGDAGAVALDGLQRDEGERRLDDDDLIRFGESISPVHVDTVDQVRVAGSKQHAVDGLFGHGADHTPAARTRELAERMGHTKASMSLDVYTHVMPPDEVGADVLLALLVR